LTGWVKDGSNNRWYVTGQTQEGPVRSDPNGWECLDGFDRCHRSEDLWFNGSTWKRHSETLAGCSAGMWFFDYPADRIYVCDDPTGQTVETSVTTHAFRSNASNVEIKNLIIEKYANPAQTGMISIMHPTNSAIKGTAWLVEGNELRYSHSNSLAGLGNNTIVRNNKIHHNGQMGFGGEGNDLLIEGNEIYFNRLPEVGFDDTWEGGACKFSLTNNLIVQDNYSHDNYGTGLWTDIDNENTIYRRNRVEDNKGNGITHEISFNAKIYDNIVKRNGFPGCGIGFLWCSQILIQGSQDVEVYGNTVEMSSSIGNGIGIIYQDRGSQSPVQKTTMNPAYQGVRYVTKNNYIHHNSITHRGSPQGASGVVLDYHDLDSTVWNSTLNKFDYNNYHVTDVNAHHWLWTDPPKYFNWTTFRAAGHEANGTIDTTMPQ